MKWFVIVLLTLVCGCRSEGPSQASSERWNSPARLKRIAKHYAEKHDIDFNFASAQPEVYIATNGVADVIFDGGSQGLLAVRILRGGEVLGCTIFTTPKTNIIIRNIKAPDLNTSPMTPNKRIG